METLLVAENGSLFYPRQKMHVRNLENDMPVKLG
jgi:hypothetical protein